MGSAGCAGGARRTQARQRARPLAQDQMTTAGDGAVTHEARSGGGPGKGVLADTRRSERGRVYGQLQLPEELPDDLAVGHGRDNPQRKYILVKRQ